MVGVDVSEVVLTSVFVLVTGSVAVMAWVVDIVAVMARVEVSVFELVEVYMLVAVEVCVLVLVAACVVVEVCDSVNVSV